MSGDRRRVRRTLKMFSTNQYATFSTHIESPNDINNTKYNLFNIMPVLGGGGSGGSYEEGPEYHVRMHACIGTCLNSHLHI